MGRLGRRAVKRTDNVGTNFVLTFDKDTINATYAKLMIANDGLTDDLGIDTASPTLAHITLLSQYEQMMMTLAPSSPLVYHAPLPVLTKPVLPSVFHHLTKQILADADERLLLEVLSLISTRGYVVPPTVWQPNKNLRTSFPDTERTLPDEYLPWCAWAEGNKSSEDKVLSADTWEDFYPAQRLGILSRLRKDKPDTALGLICQFAPTESAEKRLALVQVLAVGLNENDKEFLQSLNKDRSAKVKEFVKVLLARLGEYDGDDGVADELFEELEIDEDGIVFKPTKNNKKHQNRAEQLAMVNMVLLARKFGLTVGEFVLGWDFKGNDDAKRGYYPYNEIMLTNAVGYMNDDELIAIAEPLIKMIVRSNDDFNLWHIIRPRLPMSLRKELAWRQFVKGREFLVLARISPTCLDVNAKTLLASSSWKNLAERIRGFFEKNDGHFLTGYLANQVMGLGLVIDQDTAKACLDALAELGVTKTDPALGVLTLNALLNPA